jgi:hypothetical protein
VANRPDGHDGGLGGLERSRPRLGHPATSRGPAQHKVEAISGPCLDAPGNRYGRLGRRCDDGGVRSRPPPPWTRARALPGLGGHRSLRPRPGSR